MQKLNNPSDITALTEDQKNCLFTFSTSRSQYKASIMSGFIPIVAVLFLILVYYMLQWLATDLPTDQHHQLDEFMNFWFIKGGILSSCFGMLASLAYFARVPGQYKLMRLASAALVEQGICVQLNDKQIWDGFFAHVKLTPT